MISPSNILKQIPLFATLSEADLAALSVLLRRKKISKGEVLFRQGDEGNAMYFILMGKIKISVSRRSDTVTLAMLGPGEFLGEMALLDNNPRSADAAALEDSQLYILNRSDFLSFLKNNENSLFSILSALSMRLRKMDDLLAEMCFLNLSARLAIKLVELAEHHGHVDIEEEASDCIVKITQQELGELLGVSRESINKELKVLRDKGMISTYRSSIRIHDLESLRKRLP